MRIYAPLIVCINLLFMETKKERFIKILKRVLIGLSIGLNVFFLIAMIIGGASVKKTNKLNKVDNSINEIVEFKVNKKLVSYNDEENIITFNNNEIVNYTFNNFLNYFITNYPSGYQSDSHTGAYKIFYEEDYHCISLLYSTEAYNFIIADQFVEAGDLRELTSYVYRADYTNIGKFSYYVKSGEFMEPNECDLVSIPVYVAPALYDDVKQAIELDIQFNESTINDGIFETLTESTVAFIGSLGSGIVAMTSVFYDSANSQLTTIGLLSVIVVAVSLFYFLFRLIIGLIRMRG